MSVKTYTLACSARSLYNYSHFEFARHFESHLARPPPFYMRMRTTISDEHSIVTMLLSTRIIFSTYSFKTLREAACGRIGYTGSLEA